MNSRKKMQMRFFKKAFYLSLCVSLFFTNYALSVGYGKEVFATGRVNFGIYLDSGRFEWCLPNQVPSNVEWKLSSTDGWSSWWTGSVPSKIPMGPTPSPRRGGPSPAELRQAEAAK